MGLATGRPGRWQRLKRYLAANKISAALAAIGAAIGAIVGGLELQQKIHEAFQAREQVRTLLSVGDQFAAHDDYEKAAEEYRKAVAADQGSVEARQRLIVAMRKEAELEPPVWPDTEPGRAHIAAALQMIYELRAMTPALKNDKALLLEEVKLLELSGEPDEAAKMLAKVLANARESYADDADLLAESGFLAALGSGGTQSDGIDRILQAIAKRPQEARYHYYLAQAQEHAGRRAQAVREYRRAAELSSGEDIWSQRIHGGALGDLLQVFKKLPDEKCGVLDALPQMPLDERIGMLEYFRASSGSMDRAAPACLGALYHAVGEQAKARAQLQESLGDDASDWRYYLPRLRLLTEVLAQERPVDRAALDRARGILDQAEYGLKHEQILEIGHENGPMYKVGLKAPTGKSPDGVHVEHAFSDYPFAKAGVRDGDVVVEFAHRKVETLRDIWVPYIDFQRGTRIPLQVRRGGRTLDLELTVD